MAGDERGTELIFRSLHNTARVASNVVSREVVRDPQRTAVSSRTSRIWSPGCAAGEVFDERRLDAGIWTVGTAMGLIDDIPTVRGTGLAHRDGGRGD